jgi:tetratricopeptide (TPR) repeat protein
MPGGRLVPAVLLAVAAAVLIGPEPAYAQYEDRARDQCRDGVRAADAGRWEEAEFRWMKAIAIDAAVACGYNNLAVRNEREGDYDEAGELYEKALELATGEARADILANLDSFRAARTAETVEGDPDPDSGAGGTNDRDRRLEVTISVPEAEGRDLADFNRILVGPFIVTTPDAPVPVGPRAVAYFRRRIVQRSFLQSVDLPGRITSNAADPFQDAEMWQEMAAETRADLIFSGRIGLESSSDARVVEEQIRAPGGEITTVARFRNIIEYEVMLHYVLLRGDDGTIVAEGDLEASREFAADDEIPADDMFVETLEELLPQLLNVLTPRRIEQTRVLIY